MTDAASLFPGLQLTNPDKVLWPDIGLTKLDYIRQLALLGPYLIKHCRGRYLTTIRYPNGIDGKSFYQKNIPRPHPPFLKSVPQNGIDYVELDSLPALMWLANLACLEFHASFDRIGRPDCPDEWVLDLDPSQEEEPRIMEATVLAGELLRSLGMEAVPKTSGATGVQLIVPLVPEHGLTFEQLREVGAFIGAYLAEQQPDLFTIERLKKERGTRIYVDYLQHYSGKTIAAPYTPRARPGAPVSAPLRWDEVRRDVHPGMFNLLNMPDRLAQLGDVLEAVPPQPVGAVVELLGQLRRKRI